MINNDFLINQIILFLISLFANFMSALSGGGAGLFQLPALLFLGLPFTNALATHKVASVFLGVGSSLRHYRTSNLDIKFSFFILLIGIPGVVIGTKIVMFIDDDYASLLLGCITLFLGIYSFFKPEFGLEESFIKLTFSRLFFGGIGLFLIALLNGSLSSGSGIFVTFWLVRWFGLSYSKSLAHTLILVGFFWNGVGALSLGFTGNIKWQYAPMLILGSLTGGFLGAHFSIIKPGNIVKLFFEFITVLLGITLILKSVYS